MPTPAQTPAIAAANLARPSTCSGYAEAIVWIRGALCAEEIPVTERHARCV